MGHHYMQNRFQSGRMFRGRAGHGHVETSVYTKCNKGKVCPFRGFVALS